jgi:hypothetical protein
MTCKFKFDDPQISLRVVTRYAPIAITATGRVTLSGLGALFQGRYLTLTLGEGRSRSDDRIEYDATFMAGYHGRTIRDRLGEVRTSGEVSLSAIC